MATELAGRFEELCGKMTVEGKRRSVHKEGQGLGCRTRAVGSPKSERAELVSGVKKLRVGVQVIRHRIGSIDT